MRNESALATNQRAIMDRALFTQSSLSNHIRLIVVPFYDIYIYVYITRLLECRPRLGKRYKRAFHGQRTHELQVNKHPISTSNNDIHSRIPKIVEDTIQWIKYIRNRYSLLFTKITNRDKQKIKLYGTYRKLFQAIEI